MNHSLSESSILFTISSLGGQNSYKYCLFYSMGSRFPVVELDNANRFSNGLDPFKGASIPVA